MCWSAKNNGTNTIYIYKCRYTFSVILYIFFGYKHILWGMAFLHENIEKKKEKKRMYIFMFNLINATYKF